MTASPPTVIDGSQDVRRAAAGLAERIPAPLAPLARVAYNYRWSWLPDGRELFAGIDPARFTLVRENPVRLLQEAAPEALHAAAGNEQLLARAAARGARVFDLPPTDPASSPVAFLCAEYGVHVSLPIYSGGLGALAGDLLKQASDQGLALVAVGLMYRKGYFRQRVDAGGWQHEYWVDTDPERLPAALVREPDGAPLMIEVPIYDRRVQAQIWRIEVGRVPLFALDTDLAANAPLDRWITARLYDADPDTRLAQYVLLGVGGVRALRAMGIEPSIVHLNEGHAALAPVELAGGGLRNGGGDRDGGDFGGAGVDFGEALAAARARTVFTTHTPVPAGNDCYPAEQVSAAIGGLAGELGADVRMLIERGRTHPDDSSEPFGVTQAALRTSGAANAVSRRHGQVAREMWHSLWPEQPLEQVPIGHVTNGVHIPTWIGAPMRELLDRWLGEGWLERAADPAAWASLDEIPGAELWAARRRQRAELVEFVRERSTGDRLIRGDVREYVEAAARAFDSEVLTIGFARRVATYKRLELLTYDT